MTEDQFTTGKRVSMYGDPGTVVSGPHADWNGAYLVAIDGDGLNYVAPRALEPLGPHAAGCAS